MTQVTGFTAARMLAIEQTTIVDGDVDVNGHLILLQRDGTPIDAGLVKGADGTNGTNGTNGVDGVDGVDGAVGPPGAISFNPNVINNGGFEFWSGSTPSGWGLFWNSGASAGTVTKDGTQQAEGDWCAKYMPGGTGQFQRFGTNEFPVTPGSTVRIVMQAKAPGCTDGAQDISCSFLTNAPDNSPDWFVSGTSVQAMPVIPLSENWKTYEYAWVVPPGHTRARLYPVPGNPGATVRAIYLDAISVTTFKTDGLYIPDSGAEESYTIADNSVAPKNQWRIANTSGTAPTFVKGTDTTRVHSGAKSMDIEVTVAASGGSVYSPNFDVQPGKTYAFSVWLSKNQVATAISAYVRIAGGSTDALSEYPASVLGDSIPVVTNGATFEAQDILPRVADGWGFRKVTLVATIPAGIYRAALRIYNWAAPAPVRLYIDDIEVKEIDDPTLVTGWMAPAAFTNSWVNYNAYGSLYQVAQFRRVGDEVQLRGLVKSGTANTAIFTLPQFFRPPYSQIFPALMNAPGSWTSGAASTGTAHTHAQALPINIAGRIQVDNTGVITPTNAGNGFIDLSAIKFSVTP